MQNKVKKKIRSILPNDFVENAYKLIYFSKRGDFKHIYKKSIEKIFQKQFVRTSISSSSTHQGRQYNLQSEKVLYVFPVIDWSFRIQRPQQIAKKFHLNGHQVVYFTTTFHVAKKPGYSLTIGDNNIFVVTLFLNEPKNIYKEKLNDQNISFLLNSINILEKDLLINTRISIMGHPFWFPLAKKLSGAFTIYDCMDYHPGFGDESAHLVELEEMAMTRSDILVLTSQDLYQRFSHKNENSILVRNGCEFKYFNTPSQTTYESKFEKIIGYYGAISSWFDTTTVIKLAKLFPKYEFLLVGSTYGCENLNDLKKLSNVTLVGEVAYDQLTKYLYAFDVAIMPFMVNELTIATNPVKVYEYLSSGVPVVSTRLPEVELMGDVVYTASDITEFVSCIQKALDINDDENMQKRIAFAEQNDWQNRYIQIEQEIKKVKLKTLRVSIILVTYNNLELTKACLESMDLFNNYENCEIIIVDNLSTDGTREYLTQYEDEHKNIRAILHDSNSGFAAGNNIGIREATGDIIILLNNDTHVTPNWVQNLIKHYDADPRIGMVGPRTNNIGNEARLYSEYQSNEEMIETSYDVYYLNQSKQYEIKILAFFCVAIKKEVIAKVGLLDEIYGIGMFEDDDYCMNVKEAGYKLICADDVFIHHHLGASFNKDPEWKEKLFQKNKAIFESRWGKWEAHTYR